MPLLFEYRDPSSRASWCANLSVHVDMLNIGSVTTAHPLQVYASAVPVAYAKSTKSTDWAPFARLVLRAAYDATLAAAHVLALERGLAALGEGRGGGARAGGGGGGMKDDDAKADAGGGKASVSGGDTKAGGGDPARPRRQQERQPQQRVKVFLTALGGGAYGNRTGWICEVRGETPPVVAIDTKVQQRSMKHI